MLTLNKALAAVALATVSVSSFAAPATWTGKLTNVQIAFYPNNDYNGGNALSLFGTGSPCVFPGKPGWMLMGGGAEENAGISDALSILREAKTSGATVSITYETTDNCRIQAITR